MEDQQHRTNQVANHAHQPVVGKFVFIAIVLLVTISLGFLGGWLGSAARSNSSQQSTQQAIRTVSEQSELISTIAKNVGPSVVSVNVTTNSRQSDIFGYGGAQQSAGTGFIISEDGYVITNRHVIPSGVSEVSLVLDDGTEFDNVAVVGRTNANDPLDIAFLKIKDTKGKKLQPARIGDSDKMKVGDMAIAIGNALGQFQNTVTSGIISGYGRSVSASDGSGQSIEDLQNLFQTDAAINQGNSGGPLVNASGEVIGINTAVAGNGAENIGFAIPTNDVSGLIQSVLQEGKLLRPYLGVRYVMLSEGLADQLDIKQTTGAYILPQDRSDEVAILPNSPAEKAGLKQEDIILKINGRDVNAANSLVSEIGRHRVNETIELVILRGGNEQNISVKLESTPKD